jgi:hypothetical protein
VHEVETEHSMFSALRVYPPSQCLPLRSRQGTPNGNGPNPPNPSLFPFNGAYYFWMQGCKKANFVSWPLAWVFSKQYDFMTEIAFCIFRYFLSIPVFSACSATNLLQSHILYCRYEVAVGKIEGLIIQPFLSKYHHSNSGWRNIIFTGYDLCGLRI